MGNLDQQALIDRMRILQHGVPEVEAAAVISLDGLLMASALPEGMSEDRISAMSAAMLSLGGVPPFAGFFGKVLVFASAIEQGMIWLALVGIFNAIIGLYYYLVVLKTIYVNEPIQKEKLPLPSVSWRVAMAVCVAGILILGFLYGPFYAYAQSVASAIWAY